MIKTENFEINGIQFVRTFSDAGMQIQSMETGEIYDSAEDPAECGRIYEEVQRPDDTDLTAEEIAEMLQEVM